ncbi:MAG: TolC family outer membrane protein [Gammaproteobacteria bacterium]
MRFLSKKFLYLPTSLSSSLIIILACSIFSSAYAYSLMDVYMLAKQQDADIHIAESRFKADKLARPIARANILPQANISANTTDVKQKTDGSTFGVSGRDVEFNDHGYTLSITQALYHHDYYVQLRQAKNSVAKANIDLDASYQELITRTADAYFNVLAEQDNLSFRKSEKEAIERQLEQAKKRFEVGLIAITDVKEAQASYDLAVASEIEAQNALEISKDSLEVIIAERATELNPLSDRIQLITPDPNNVDEWINKALSENLSLLSSQYTKKIAQQEIKLQQSQHYPKLDIVASHTDTDTGGLTGSRESEDTRIGLELSFPIFEGGRTYYKTKEAHHRAEQSSNEHEKIRRETIKNTRDAYLNVISGISRVKALAQALESTEAAARAAEAGFQVGTRTSVDVLLALQETFRAKRDFSRARYDYLLNTLNLKQAVGTLSVDDLVQIDGWLN